MVGRRLGHYRIVARLGQGGMGVVYRADDVNLRRPVAVKILPETLAGNPFARERLIREARAASRLNHQNIATVYEVGEQDGELFMAMEYVDGEPLNVRLRRGPLSADELLRIGIQTADALREAHAHGVIHRDIKPGNIMLRPDGTVKVVDFGLALRTRTEAAPDGKTGITETFGERLTADGHAPGTVSYMSPEQAQDGSADHRGDIFALGTVLYEAATGKVPFGGNNPLAVAAAIMHDDPRPPREIVPEVSAPLQEIILSCLAKDPAQRPQSAGAVRDALRGLQEGMTTLTIRRVLGRRPVRRGLVYGAAAVAALSVLAAAVFWVAREPSPRIRDLEARRLFDQGREYEDRGYTYRALQLAEEQYANALKLEPDNPWLQAHLANLLSRIELQYPAEGRAERVRELVEQSQGTRKDIAQAWLARGRLQLRDGEVESAIESALEAKRAARNSHEGYVLHGTALVRAGRVDEGLEELRLGIDVGKGHIWARSALARALLDRGRLNEAAAEYDRVLQYAPGFPNALNNLGAIYLYTGQYLECIPLFTRSLELESDDGAAANLGTAFFFLGQLDRAIAAYEKAVELAPDHPSYKRNLGEAHEKRGDPNAARDWYRGAITDCTRAFDVGIGNVEMAIDWAFCAAKLERFEEARRVLGGQLEREPDNMYLLRAAAQVHAMAGERDTAYGFVGQAIEAGFPREDLRRDECFRPYRNDPEFLSLLTAPGKN